MTAKKCFSLIVVILCIFMVNILLASCSKSNDDSQKNGTTSVSESTTSETKEVSKPVEESTTQTNEYTLPIVEPGSVTLTFGTIDNWLSSASYANVLPVKEEIEKRTGVKVVFEVLPSNEYTAAMQTRLAAARDLPDLILIPPRGSNISIPLYAKEGLIIPIEELIEQHAPNIQKKFEEIPYLKNILVAPDGHTYTVVDYSEAAHVTNFSSAHIRKDWLDKLNLDVPETIDDWYGVLKAFKERDPNETGNDDVIPISHGQLGHYIFFGTGFGMPAVDPDGLNPWWTDDDGNVSFVYSSQEFKELLYFVNKLYSENLMDQELTRNVSARDSLVSRNVMGSFVVDVLVKSDTWQNMLIGAGVEDANNVLVLPPKGPDGSRNLITRGPVSAYFAITKACKNPEVAIKWIDYVWVSEEGILFSNYGIEGTTYNLDSDGNPLYTDLVTNNPDNLALMDVLRSYGAMPSHLLFNTRECAIQRVSSSTRLLSMAEEMWPHLVDPFPSMMPTEEEVEINNRVWPDIQTYYQEMISKFIIGSEPLENFDKYVGQLKNMGIEDMTKTKQQQFDRFNK